MKFSNVALPALAGWLMVFGSIQAAVAQNEHTVVELQTPGKDALWYFTNCGARTLTDKLKSIRPHAVSAEQRAQLVAGIRNDDIVAPSRARQAKLDSLRRVLNFHERPAVEVKIIRLGLAWAGFYEGAAIVVSEEAVDLLTAEELQAVVAHELGHEYFAAEYESARQNEQHDKVKEIEHRCDGVAIITLVSLGLDPKLLVSGFTKLTEFNDARGARNNTALMAPLSERMRFCRAMVDLVRASDASQQSVAKK